MTNELVPIKKTETVEAEVVKIYQVEDCNGRTIGHARITFDEQGRQCLNFLDKSVVPVSTMQMGRIVV